jgi:hypothetical protein
MQGVDKQDMDVHGKPGQDGEQAIPNGMDEARLAGARRRVGFVAFLWWLAALSGTIGLVQGMSAGLARRIFVGVAWVLAILFTYAWRHVRPDRGKS